MSTFMPNLGLVYTGADHDGRNLFTVVDSRDYSVVAIIKIPHDTWNARHTVTAEPYSAGPQHSFQDLSHLIANVLVTVAKLPTKTLDEMRNHFATSNTLAPMTPVEIIDAVGC